ncbi:hypothetical protein [Dyadobacter sp. 32]|uniref:hypothetical protein n=1 Tax=Dyadobacter sp. 32 TaxID=538966 RepID=UPI0011EE3EA8
MALTSHSKQFFLAAAKYILFMSLAYIGFSCDEKRQPYYKEACSKSTVGMDLESITDWDTISSGEIKINRNVGMMNYGMPVQLNTYGPILFGNGTSKSTVDFNVHGTIAIAVSSFAGLVTINWENKKRLEGLGNNFYLTDFLGGLNLSQSDTAKTKLSFSQCQIGGQFYAAIVNDDLSLSGNNFCGDAIFYGTSPVKNSTSLIDLEGCSFRGDTLTFHQLHLETPPDLTFCLLPEYLVFSNFRNLQWKEPLDLRTCRISGNDAIRSPAKCKLRFEASSESGYYRLDASKFIIPYDKFEIEFGEKTTPYQRLKILGEVRESCKKQGMTYDYGKWDIIYRKLDNIDQWSHWGKIMNFTQSIWWNFGYSEWIIVVFWMPFFFLLFWCINFLKIRHIVTHIYFDGDLGGNFVNVPQLKNDTLFEVRLDKASDRWSYSFFLTAVLYFGLKLKHEAVNYRNGGGMAYIYFMYFVGLFHVAYAFAFFFK